MAAPIIVWFRRDLRLVDNPALASACASGRPVLPVYILDDADQPGAASDWWLHHSLDALAASLAKIGLPLVLRRAPAEQAIPALAAELSADAVYWNRLYDPATRPRDEAIKTALKSKGLEVESFPGAVIREPWELKTGAGKPYGVFTPFWKAMLALGAPPAPLPAPTQAAKPDIVPPSDALSDWQLLPVKPDWAVGFRTAWTPGEDGARACWAAFAEDGLNGYGRRRDFPGDNGVSRLSTHLHFGEVSPRQLWQAAKSLPDQAEDALAFLRELAWRDFNHQLLFHNPGMVTRNYNESFDAFPWRDDEAGFQAWTRGQTGYPLIDAGMRELWQTGYMHNRVRMAVASFLVKHLLIDWRKGEAWFRDTLVDADIANNVANWQWVAGCGADAAPYFRIFNPILQGEKFDPDGRYTRHFVPELAKLPDRFLHKPWDAPARVLEACGITLGRNYPEPVVDHGFARERALTAYRESRNER